MSKPKISVIIPVYNTEEFIEKTIKSILEQTLTDLEVIAVDDGSTDGSLQVIRCVATSDSRVKVISQRNSGQAVARNNGFEQAQGEYTYFMDSDDLLAEDALERCYQRCVEHNLDFVFFDADIFNDLNQVFDPHYYHRTKGLESKIYRGTEILNLQLQSLMFRAPVWLNLINSSFIRRIELRSMPGMKHEDQMFMAMLYTKADRVGFISEPFFKRRIRDNSIMTSKVNPRNVDDYFIVAAELTTFAVGQNNEVKHTVNMFIDVMLNAALTTVATKLDLRNRLSFACRYICRYKKHLRIRTLAILMFKTPINRLLR